MGSLRLWKVIRHEKCQFSTTSRRSASRRSVDPACVDPEHVCEIRKCNIEKNTPHCSACNMYKCEKIEKFIQLAPQIGMALESLRGKTKN
ncbi:MAG: hypothetical protein FJ130_03545 [Deltaproteobacteria bacterium]|nr:hypothetical protein [Deltaproteobacteria bacterium]